MLAANGVDTMLAMNDEYTPTPAVSHAIITHNRGRTSRLADGIVVTPSHNPPDNGGFKYNPTNGGPAADDITKGVQDAANALPREGPGGRQAHDATRKALRGADDAPPRLPRAGMWPTSATSIDMAAIRDSKIHLGVDPLGGAGVHYWGRIAEQYGLDLTVVSDVVDPTFGFMTLDWDGKIRMDPSSPYAMARLVDLKSQFDVAFACDTDHDRHGIVTRSAGLMQPNAYLAVCDRLPVPQSPAVERAGGDRQDGGVLAHDRPRRAAAAAPDDRGAGRLQVVRARAWPTAAWASAARRARAPPSCAATAASWTTDKDGLDAGAAGRRDHRAGRAATRARCTTR